MTQAYIHMPWVWESGHGAHTLVIEPLWSTYFRNCLNSINNQPTRIHYASSVSSVVFLWLEDYFRETWDSFGVISIMVQTTKSVSNPAHKTTKLRRGGEGDDLLRRLWSDREIGFIIKGLGANININLSKIPWKFQVGARISFNYQVEIKCGDSVLCHAKRKDLFKWSYGPLKKRVEVLGSSCFNTTLFLLCSSCCI